MLNKAFFQRIIPFILTFALGLFIASFFISVTPTFKYRKNKCCKRSEVKRLQYENERLRLENQRLQQRIESTEKIILLDEPPPMPRIAEVPMHTVPAAPIAPKAK